MQTHSHSVPLPRAHERLRKAHPILASLVGAGALLCEAGAGEWIPAKPSPNGREIVAPPKSGSDDSFPEEQSSANEKGPETSPRAADGQVFPPDLLPPELSTLPDPVIERGRATRPEARAKLRDESIDEDPEPAAEEQTEESLEPFVVPGFYGSGSKEFTTGKGRLAAAPLETTFTLGLGYDDNIRAATSGSGAEKVASSFTTARLATSYHTTGLMQLFVFDAFAGTDIYWGRQDPGYDLSLGISYVRRFVSPARVTGNVQLSYQTQPDYSQVNLVRGPVAGEGEDDTGVLSASAKSDLSYAWTAQFSTLTSISVESILYGGSRSEADSIDITVGNEMRYRHDRYTWIGETRYQFNTRPNDQEQEGASVFLLAGGEWHLGPWIQVSGRIGGIARSYQDGGTTTSPHGELVLNFQPNVQNSYALSARYGLERTAVEGGDSKTFRVGATYTRVFTSRMSGVISASYLRSDERSQFGDRETAPAGSSGGTEQIFDATAALNYRLTSQIALSASLTCTRGTAAEGAADPDRNRFTLTASYQF